jgi:hypothetical protein
MFSRNGENAPMGTRPGPRCDAGIALLLVVVCLATLIAIAVPFAISMVVHERSTKSDLDAVHASYAAEGARAHALAQVFKTHPSRERSRTAIAPFNTPGTDTLDEFSVDWTAGGLDTSAEIANPKGVLWSVDELQDEQGKINIRTAPKRVLDNLTAVLGKGNVDVRAFVTERSSRPADWICPQNIRGMMKEQISGVGMQACFIDDIQKFGPGTVVRITDGGTVIYDEVSDIRQGRVLVKKDLPSSIQIHSGVIEAQVRHPVNINTAPREVLAAVLAGLSSGPNDEVTIGEAKGLADRMVRRTFKDGVELAEFINDMVNNQIISPEDGMCILTNAADPCSRVCLKRTSPDAVPVPTGTMPFCYKSFGVVTIEATGIVNNPAGNQTARRTIREVVEAPPPVQLGWPVDSQADFESEMEANFGRFAGGRRTMGAGLKIVTYPNACFNGDTPDASSTGRLALRASEDYRGGTMDHFTNTHEGTELSGAGGIAYAPGALFRRNQFDVDAGGIEMWVKFDSVPGAAYFLDSAQNEFENRVCVAVSGGRLYLRASDATLDHKYAEISAPFAPAANTWHHIGAYWKGTKFAHLALMIDGMPVGTFRHCDETGRVCLAKLSGNIAAADTDIGVDTTSGFPTAGVIEIGDEAIEYAASAGGSFTTCVRGARGTIAQDHPAGAAVTVYGYANPVANITYAIPLGQGAINIAIDRIPLVSGTLLKDLPETNPVATQINKPGSDTAPGGILAADTTIPVNATDGFPDRGFIRVQQEVVFYGSKTSTSFDSCQRGQLGTVAADHRHGANIMLFSIEASSITGYANPGIIQIENEWFAPMVPLDRGADGRYFVGIVTPDGFPIPFFRALFGTTLAAHTTGAKIIPVFAEANPFCGAGDIVTIVPADQTQDKEQRQVNIARVAGGFNLVAFTDFTTREHVADGTLRLMKFPSGELMSWLPANIMVAASCPYGGNGSGGSWGGLLDELKFIMAPRGDFKVAASTQPGDGSVTMNGVGGLAALGGIVKVGDEYVAYAATDTTNGQIIGCQRGWRGTPVWAHASGERAFNMSFLPVTSLGAALGPDDPIVTLASTQQPGQDPYMQSGGFPDEGYVLVDNEMIGYCWKIDCGLSMPPDKSGSGIFRGSFGTQAAGHASGAIVYAPPFRYWDRYRPLTQDSEMIYFQGSMRATDALWGRVTWAETVPAAELDVRVVARVDGAPSWDTSPTNKPGGLFEFTDPGARNELNAKGSQIEYRIYFEYRDGAFQTDAWKATPVVDSVNVSYTQPVTVFSHEEK